MTVKDLKSIEKKLGRISEDEQGKRRERSEEKVG